MFDNRASFSVGSFFATVSQLLHHQQQRQQQQRQRSCNLLGSDRFVLGNDTVSGQARTAAKQTVWAPQKTAQKTTVLKLNLK